MAIGRIHTHTHIVLLHTVNASAPSSKTYEINDYADRTAQNQAERTQMLDDAARHRPLTSSPFGSSPDSVTGSLICCSDGGAKRRQ